MACWFIVRNSLSIPALKRVLSDHYPFKNSKIEIIKELSGFVDKNYLFTVSSNAVDKEECASTNYVLKIMNPKDSSLNLRTDLVTAAMSHAYSHGIPCPKLIPSEVGQLFAAVRTSDLINTSCERKEGACEGTEVDSEGHSAVCHMVVMSYISGVDMSKVPHPKDLLYQYGSLAGKLDSLWLVRLDGYNKTVSQNITVFSYSIDKVVVHVNIYHVIYCDLTIYGYLTLYLQL